MAQVLLVSRDVKIGTPIADELERAGHEVMWCPGPKAPVYVCAAGRAGRCALTRDADVVVLDGWLASDEVRQGIPWWHLLLYYREHELPVVILTGPDGLPGPHHDPEVVALPRRTTASSVLESVESLLGRASRVRRAG